MSSTTTTPPPLTVKDIDLDKLVRLVEVRPVIWNKSVEGYRNSKITKAAWHDIFNELDKCYRYMNEEQKNEYGKVVISKWTSARDVWQRGWKKRREQGEPDPVPGSKEAIKFEKLKFLIKVYDRDNEIQQMIKQRPQEHDQGPISENSLDSEATTVYNMNLNRENRRINNNNDKADQPRSSDGHQSAGQPQRPRLVINLGDGTTNPSNIPNIIASIRIPQEAKTLQVERKQQVPEKEPVTHTVKEDNSISSSTCHMKVEPNEPICLDSEEAFDEAQEYAQEEDENRTPKMPKEENRRYLSEKRYVKSESEDSSDDERSSKRRRFEDDKNNELLQAIFMGLTPLLKECDCKQLIDFQVGALELVKKIKYT